MKLFSTLLMLLWLLKTINLLKLIKAQVWLLTVNKLVNALSLTPATANMVINANINITKQSARTKIVQTKHVPSDTQNPVSTKNLVGVLQKQIVHMTMKIKWIRIVWKIKLNILMIKWKKIKKKQILNSKNVCTALAYNQTYFYIWYDIYIL